MIVYIFRQEKIPYNICNELANKLCETKSVVTRIADYADKDNTEIVKDLTILLNTSETSATFQSKLIERGIEFSIPLEKPYSEATIFLMYDQIKDFIREKEDYWVKDEKGWWYLVDRKHHGGILDIITQINGKYYCIGMDYYMKTGWVPVEVNEEFSCLYFDPTDGHLDDTKDKLDMPDPFGFSYPPIKVKWY